MKFTLLELRNMEPVLSKMLNTDVFDVRVAYRFSKFLKLMSKELQDLEEVRQKLVRKYGTANEAGDIEVLPERIAEFTSEFALVLNEEVEIPMFMFNLKDLEGLKLSPADLILIEKMMADEVEEPFNSEDIVPITGPMLIND